MGYMKNLAIRVEEQVERMLGIQGIESGSPAWDEWKVPLVDSLQRWVDREFIQPQVSALTLTEEQWKEREAGLYSASVRESEEEQERQGAEQYLRLMGKMIPESYGMGGEGLEDEAWDAMRLTGVDFHEH